MYSAGLRISEGLNLKVLDIDSERMTLKINQGKGQKDRYVPISPRLLTELRLYWRDQRPSEYFFPRDRQVPGTCGRQAPAVENNDSTPF